MEMPKVLNCTVEGCVYNKDEQCHALAITVGDSTCPMCDTALLTSGKKGGVMEATGGVGACRVDTCKFNNSWECAAQAINVRFHSNHADCATFRAR